MLTFIFLNILVLSSALFIVYKALGIREAVDSLLALFVVYFCQIVLIELVVGVSGLLFLKNVVILSVILFCVISILTKNKKLYLPDFNFKVLFEAILNNRLYVFILSVGLAFAAVKILINLLNPPFGWDSLNYHFTFAVEWLKSGNLNTPITVFDDPSPTYYPLNGSLFYLWLILPFKSVFLADLGQLPFFVIAVICVYAISRKIGLDRKFSFLCAMLFMLIPNFFKQLQIAYVDVMVGSLFLVCINWLFLLKDNFNLKNVLIYSLSLGLLIGTKTIALPYSILLLIPFLVIYLKNYRRAALIPVFILGVLLFGGFSYLCNLIETSNPLYPLDFKLFGIQLFRGVMDKAVYSSHFIASDYSLAKMLFHEGLGGQALFFILPGVFLGLPVVFLKRKNELDFNLAYFLILPILVFIVYRYIIPLANVRYLYVVMGIGVILGMSVFNLLKINRRAVNLLAFICVLSSIPTLAKRQELVFSLVISALLFLFLLNLKRLKFDINKKIFFIVPVILILSTCFLAQNFYDQNESSRYHKMVKYSGFWPDAALSWDWLNKNTDANNIAYTGRAVPFPLYGDKLKNNVYYVSVNKVQPAKVHYFADSRYEYTKGFETLLKAIEQKNNYRGNADYNVWLENLKKKDTQFFFVYSLQQTKTTIFPLEDEWARMHQDRFREVFANNTIHIYRVLK